MVSASIPDTTGFGYTQLPSIHNGAPGDVPDLRTYTHIDSVNVTTGRQNLMQAVRLVNRNLSSWTLRLEAFAKSLNEGRDFRVSYSRV
jgi:hypothetical protein